MLLSSVDFVHETRRRLTDINACSKFKSLELFIELIKFFTFQRHHLCKSLKLAIQEKINETMSVLYKSSSINNQKYKLEKTVIQFYDLSISDCDHII